MVLGVDLSSGYAMSAAAAYWPETGRLQGICAFPEEPGLKARGEADGVGSLYEQMATRAELLTTTGRTVNIGNLLNWALSEYGSPSPWSVTGGGLPNYRTGSTAWAYRPGWC